MEDFFVRKHEDLFGKLRNVKHGICQWIICLGTSLREIPRDHHKYRQQYHLQVSRYGWLCLTSWSHRTIICSILGLIYIDKSLFSLIKLFQKLNNIDDIWAIEVVPSLVVVLSSNCHPFKCKGNSFLNCLFVGIHVFVPQLTCTQTLVNQCIMKFKSEVDCVWYLPLGSS